MGAVTIEVNGSEVVIAVLDTLADTQWDPLLRTVGDAVRTQTINHFIQGGGPDGPWVPLASGGPSYLIATGTLKNSIEWRLGDMQVAVGPGVQGWYGVFHQEGLGHNPIRRFLGLTEDDQNELRDIVENYISDVAHSAGA
jgi:phage gpG-like protein